MVFGEALIKAYELESGVAIFPRVIFSKQAQEFDVKLEFEGETVSTNQLRKDSDKLFFLDYLNFPKDNSIQSLAANSMHWVADRLNDENDIRILQKLSWHINYLESILQT